MNNSKVDISIVIPAYNEQDRIGSTIQRINEYIKTKNSTCEIIIVDDGSTDATQEVLEPFKRNGIKVLRNKINMGKGAAVRNGILSSSGDYILITDADLSTPIEEIEKLMKCVSNDYDIAIASRGLKQSLIKKRQPFYRQTMGKTFNFFVRMLVLKDFKDTQCGFKLMKSKTAKRIFEKQKLDRFAFDVEILLIAKKMGYKIKEIPAIWINSPNTKVKAFSDSFRMLCDLFRLRFSRYYREI